jgi:hypothetical protein
LTEARKVDRKEAEMFGKVTRKRIEYILAASPAVKQEHIITLPFDTVKNLNALD